MILQRSGEESRNRKILNRAKGMLSWKRDLIVRVSRPKGLFIREGSSDIRSRRVKCNSVLSHMGYAAARHPSKTRVCSHSLVAKYPNWSERRLVSEAESDIPPSRSKLAEMREKELVCKSLSVQACLGPAQRPAKTVRINRLLRLH